MKLLKKIAKGALLLLLVLQFIPTKKNDGDIVSLLNFYEETKTTTEVKTILEKACIDCHSNTTQYPWYHKIAPIKFWMNHHVEEGKEHLNFSEWSGYSLKRKEHKMEEVWEEVEEKEMPLKSYTWTHANAKLTDSEIAAIINWAKGAEHYYKQELGK